MTDPDPSRDATPAMEICNSCDINPMEPGSEAGYCAECHDAAGERQDQMRAEQS